MHAVGQTLSESVLRRVQLVALIAVAGACAALVSAPAAFARCAPDKHGVLRVGSYEGKHGQCKTIQSAVKAAQPGDWILIGPGDYKQSSTEKAPGAVGDDRAGADVLVTTPNLHIRGMNRNTVVIDGTKPGSPQCSSKESDQYLGVPEGGGGHSGNNGVLVYKASGVWLQNFTACNFLDGNDGGGNEIWFDGQQASGRQEIGSWWGEYLSATSTYWGGTEKPSATYGVYASNTFGPGVFENAYASNMSDSGVYIGACPDCNTVINKSQFEGNDLGYSGSNSGGHLTIENTEFNNNEEGVATTSQNNDDAPSPQEGLCPGGKLNPAPPAGAQRNNICWVMIHSRIVENNNGGTPTSGGAPGLLGTGMTDAGGRNDLIIDDTFSANNAWGILVITYPGLGEKPPEQVLNEFPQDECRGGVGTTVGTEPECVYEAYANEVANNTFGENGSFGNPSNGDIGEVNHAEPAQLINCWHGNVETAGGELTGEPSDIQTTKGTCSTSDAAGAASTTLAAQAACDSRIQPELSECTELPGSKYPRAPAVKLLSVQRMNERSPTMPNPCEGVPRNRWCPHNARPGKHARRSSR
jgi:hypothetical protein